MRRLHVAPPRADSGCEEGMMGYVDGMIVQWDGSKPHVKFIMKTLAEQFPYSIWKIGGQKDRKTRKGAMSFHKTGRAADIYLDAHDPLDAKLGQLLFEMFMEEAESLKVHHVIFNRKIWSAEEGGPRAHDDDDPHLDHVHVAFSGPDLNLEPLQFVEMCKRVHAAFVASSGDARDRSDGLYGKAFNRRRPNTRLNKTQRREILKANMGMKGC
jgi:hypothetical protein